MYLWSEIKPKLHEGQLLVWKTKHVRLGCKMTMTGMVQKMRNGWTDTTHLLPPMTRWDGYKHIIPYDLEWSYDVPQWVLDMKSRYPVYLLDVEGVELKPCPFCGESAMWYSRDGFIGSMPHQDNQFAIGHCLKTGHYINPESCANLWNRRV
jgi:hypothetical protein